MTNRKLRPADTGSAPEKIIASDDPPRRPHSQEPTITAQAVLDLANAGQTAEVEDWLSRIADNSPPEVVYQVAEIHAEQGQRIRAFQLWSRLAEDDHQPSQSALEKLFQRENVQNGFEWLLSLSRGGDETATLEIIRSESLNNYESHGVQWLFKLSQAGSCEAKRELLRLAALEKDTIAALGFLVAIHPCQELSDTERAEHQYLLGANQNSRGKLDQAEFWLRRASAHGHLEASRLLVDVLEQSEKHLDARAVRDELIRASTPDEIYAYAVSLRSLDNDADEYWLALAAKRGHTQAEEERNRREALRQSQHILKQSTALLQHAQLAENKHQWSLRVINLLESAGELGDAPAVLELGLHHPDQIERCIWLVRTAALNLRDTRVELGSQLLEIERLRMLGKELLEMGGTFAASADFFRGLELQIRGYPVVGIKKWQSAMRDGDECAARALGLYFSREMKRRRGLS